MDNTVIEKETANPNVNDMIGDVIQKINSNSFTFHFYMPPMNTPSGGIGVLLKMASVLKENGFGVKVWYEPRYNQQASYEASNRAKKRVDIFDYFNPDWVEFSIKDIPFLALGEKEEEINLSDGSKIQTTLMQVNPEDILLIPEGFPNVMEKTVRINCKRVVVAQSWAYILLGMRHGQIWQGFGIKDVISVSDCITEYLNAIMPGLNIKKLNQGINRNVFKNNQKVSSKYPMIGYQKGRGPESEIKINNAIRMFYALNPHMRWFRFIELSNMSRQSFAETLSNCAFVLYTDDIAGFGTLPLEAMACGTHVIGYASPGGKEYITEDNGFWCHNGDVFQLAELMGIAVEKWVSGELDAGEISQTYEETLSSYTEDGERERILEIVNELKNERINELEKSKTA